MDLAVGVIIGAAFGKIVTSFTENLIMPLLNPLLAVTPRRLAGVDNSSRAKNRGIFRHCSRFSDYCFCFE